MSRNLDFNENMDTPVIMNDTDGPVGYDGMPLDHFDYVSKVMSIVDCERSFDPLVHEGQLWDLAQIADLIMYLLVALLSKCTSTFEHHRQIVNFTASSNLDDSGQAGMLWSCSKASASSRH